MTYVEVKNTHEAVKNMIFCITEKRNCVESDVGNARGSCAVTEHPKLVSGKLRKHECELLGAFHSTKNSGLKSLVANGTVFSGRLRQPVTFQVSRENTNKPKQTNGGLVASFTCFDDIEVKMNNIFKQGR